MSETKLIVDQPDRVTNEGTVEQVAKTQPVVQKLNEGLPKPSIKTNEDVLLTGDVLDGVEILG